MKIKHHQQTLLEIYVDTRMALYFPKKPSTLAESFKAAMIKMAVKEQHAKFVEKYKPGRYEIRMTNFNWANRQGDFIIAPLD